MRFEVMLEADPFSAEAMETCKHAINGVQAKAASLFGPNRLGGMLSQGEALGKHGKGRDTSAWLPAAAPREAMPPIPRVCATGFTPYIMNIKALTGADHRHVTAYVISVILVILVVWNRKPLLAIAMLGATLIVYYATLGMTHFVFANVMGSAGVDGKVRLIVFVILVAVGQDHNIFLVSRLLQERRDHAAAATWRAIAATGSVISSCGLIMAAMLGSLLAAGLPLYQQLGFAFGFGVLLDTFVIRPVVVPGLYLSLKLKRIKRVDLRSPLP